MRLGGPTNCDISTPELWIEALQQRGYRAAYCPLPPTASDEQIQAYGQAARKANIVIAEVGAWSNPLSSDESERRKAIEGCQAGLELADKIGAKCCVNIAGSRGENWDGPHPLNYAPETFEMIVQNTREIIDAVQPKHTVFSLETMPWIWPDSPDSYLELMRAIDRPSFGIHLDPVNMICSPQRFFDNAGFLRECFAKLGPYLVGVHAKDIALAPRLTTHLDEVRPGLGSLDYRTFLSQMNALDPDIPLMLEHLPDENEYALAAEYVRGVAEEIGVQL